MIKNIVFDIGNVILNFEVLKVIPHFTNDINEQKFILDNIINSPEWSKYSLIDTGYLTKEAAIEIVKDRTNHIKDELIESFWNHYNDYASINKDVIDLIKKLLDNNYNVYLLSNINPYTYDSIKESGIFELVNGFILSYQVHSVKPHLGIYNELINKYKLNPSECLFIDDKQDNIDVANQLGFKGIKVKPDDFNSVKNGIILYNINI